MIKNNKWKALFSSLVILLPMLFGLIVWNKLPPVITTHWGADGIADGFGSKAFAVFAIPAILLALHWLCLFLSTLDKKQQGQNKKLISLVFWIIPFISLFTAGLTYSVAFGKTFRFEVFLPLLMGIMFVLMGNYLPKTTQNRTLGIKISWTLGNEENWNKTHRLAGKVWVIGGLVMLFCVFLPLLWMIVVTIGVMLALMIIPMVYSYCIYKRHQKEGIVYAKTFGSKTEKIVAIVALTVLLLLLAGVAVVMFTGRIDVQYEETAFRIEASYYSDLKVEYAAIDSIEYRETTEVGVRANGFASARLSMGVFQNDEFGYYTRYAYTSERACVVLHVDGKTLVISGKNEEKTKEIYEAISARIPE